MPPLHLHDARKCMGYPHRDPVSVSPSEREASGESGDAVLAFLQGAQARVRTRLVEQMGEKLLTGEQAPHQAFEGEGLDELLFMQNLDTASCGIQMQDDAMTDQLSRDRIAFEIDADHAVPIDFAHQMQPIEQREPAVRIDRGRQWG